MKKIFLAIVIMSVISCKEDKKEKKNLETEIKKELTFTKVNIPSYTSWGKVRADLEETTEAYNQEKVFTLSRNSFSESSFAHTQNILVNFESIYRVSIIVKGGENNNFFGLRIVGSYPDRADAIFDLSTGSVIGVKKERDFKNPEATIEALDDGWYKCSLIAEPYSSEMIKIMFGPTIQEKPVLGWEGAVDQKNDIFIIPTSLKLEEIID